MIRLTLNFTLHPFQKKNIICKMLFLNQETPCHHLKIFKLSNKNKERLNNVREAAVIFPQIFRETLGALVLLLGITKV